MTLKTKALSVVAFDKNFTLWHYRSPDREIGPGYFDKADDLLSSGDMILANLGDGSAGQVGIYLITGESGGSVIFDDLSAGTFGTTPPAPPAAPAPDEHAPQLEERQKLQANADTLLADRDTARQEVGEAYDRALAVGQLERDRFREERDAAKEFGAQAHNRAQSLMLDLNAARRERDALLGAANAIPLWVKGRCIGCNSVIATQHDPVCSAMDLRAAIAAAKGTEG